VVFARDTGIRGNHAVIGQFPGRSVYKLYGHDTYEIRDYPTQPPTRDIVPLVPHDASLTVEALPWQVTFLQNAQVVERKTGDYGAGWKNHDELQVVALGPGAEIAFGFEFERASERTVSIALTRAPGHGGVELWIDDTRIRGVSLDAPRVEHHIVTLPARSFEPGTRLIRLRPTGVIGLDWVRLDLP